MILSLAEKDRAKSMAFTLIELMGVVTVIAILAGLTLGGAGAVRRHGAVSQAKGEVAALEAACGRYYADFNAYPANTSNNPSAAYQMNIYNAVGSFLFLQLYGANQYSARPTLGKRYIEPKPAMVSSTNSANPYFTDPWGNAYGYFSDGTNAPLVWSTGGATNQTGTNKWITSWPRS
jgi:type II secretory pathway pseudopilin PulG